MMEFGVNMTLSCADWWAIAHIIYQEDEALTYYILDEIAECDETLTIYGLTQDEVNGIKTAFEKIQSRVEAEIDRACKVARQGT